MTGVGGDYNEGIIFSISTTGGNLTDIHNFRGTIFDAINPLGSLTLSGGTMYGMTEEGGAYSNGIIFSIATTGGTLTDLHDFSGSLTDGADPQGFLTLSGSTLYGMATYGGAYRNGIIFSIATSGGTLTDLHDFSGSATDGAYPRASLTLSAGALYGTAVQGGASNNGIIFSIATTGGALTDLHDFSGSATDGANPSDNLTLIGSKFYGMTFNGGASGDGIIFSIATTGGSLTDLHDFSESSTDGGNPEGDLTLFGSKLYGMTFGGGASSLGIIFSIAITGGSLTDMHDFSASSTDGGNPEGNLILSGSTLYGMTVYGGAYGDGLIFSIPITGGTLTDLHDFSGSTTDGSDPEGSLTLSGSTLYGMTVGGGSYVGYGIIFSYYSSSIGSSQNSIFYGTDF
jgi:uncharacterized repeat protein (TIGR03803 family)